MNEKHIKSRIKEYMNENTSKLTKHMFHYNCTNKPKILPLIKKSNYNNFLRQYMELLRKKKANEDPKTMTERVKSEFGNLMPNSKASMEFDQMFDINRHF